VVRGQRSTNLHLELSSQKPRGAHATLGSSGTFGAGQGDGGHEELRVRIVRGLHQESRVAGLDNRTAIQHDDIPTGLIGCRQIVG
jgi:hypothetical protein